MFDRIKSKFPILLSLLLVIAWTIYSYAFLDIGLTLTTFGLYLSLQKKMRWFGYFNRPQSTLIFVLLNILLYLIYYLLISYFKRGRVSFKKILVLAILSCGVLVLSYPAFSHDIFNYIFNAKMILVYKANPHIHSAWEFPDPMLGFMRNIHTPAPYFYGWTIISLLPYLIGAGRIFPELISFKLFSILYYFLTYIILSKIYSILNIKSDKLRLTLFLLNPLILIEAIGIGHNDLSMMFLVLASFYFLLKYKSKQKFYSILLAILFLIASISIKYATIVLLPLLIIWYFKNDFDIGLWGGVILFLLPFIRPLDQLHSWYLIWTLVWVLLSKKMAYIYLFYFVSFFAFLRYAPYIWYGNWDPPVLSQRLIIYLAVPILSVPFFLCKKAH